MTLVWNLSRKLMQSLNLTSNQINTETEESLDDSKVYSEKENVNYSAISTGYFPYYRSNEEQFVQPLLYGLNAEEEKPESNWKNEGEGECAELGGDAEKTTHPALRAERKPCSSMANVEPTSQQLLGGSTLGSCLPTFSLSTTLPSLDWPFSSTGYVPYYRTEAELHVGPAMFDRFLTRTEISENEEGRWVEEKNTWNFGASCLVS
ncbi:uncharacterized protein LOC104913276 isoform X2 [Meleagris gallopavo]|uniref:uncharacterized protein LOC104913276 isoform X2 n=1 Tax=Meleagris gallopavo TaxID=9103 RepID=UPI000549D208|nr:uncharacterized protein LOC104913276 isoform X2 [Meleagris gallopavo]XP_019475990.1 uncharacterized protein LOC104913276 isoform X2 [Meleagris gallopavo]